MQTGLRVSLNSSGNNTVDVRALLLRHNIRLPNTRRLENDEPDSDGEIQPRTQAQLDVYDGDDGFIDDGDIVEDTERVVVPKGKDGSEADSVKGGLWKRGGGGIARVVVDGMERVHPGFYVNRGEIEMQKVKKRKKKVLIKKPDRGGTPEDAVERAGDVYAPDVPVTALPVGQAIAEARPGASADSMPVTIVKPKPKPKSQPALPTSPPALPTEVTRAKSTVPLPPPVAAMPAAAGAAAYVAGAGQASSGSSVAAGAVAGEKRKVDPSASGSGGGTLKKRKSVEGAGSGVSGGVKLSENVLKLVGRMRALCKDIYKEKKPAINKSPQLQDVLDMLVGVCRKEGVCKPVHEKQTVTMPDELWKELDFLRTTRANLETLSWALLWDGVERKAKEEVGVAEVSLKKLARGKSIVGGEIDEDELRRLVIVWWKARIMQLDAANKLCEPGKEKSVKRLQSSWLDILSKACGKNTDVTRDVLASMVRCHEEELAAEERFRKESERLEREERKAAKAAKKLEREKAAAEAKLRIANSSTVASTKGSVLSQLASIVKGSTGQGAGGLQPLPRAGLAVPRLGSLPTGGPGVVAAQAGEITNVAVTTAATAATAAVAAAAARGKGGSTQTGAAAQFGGSIQFGGEARANAPAHSDAVAQERSAPRPQAEAEPNGSIKFEVIEID